MRKNRKKEENKRNKEEKKEKNLKKSKNNSNEKRWHIKKNGTKLSKSRATQHQRSKKMQAMRNIGNSNFHSLLRFSLPHTCISLY